MTEPVLYFVSQDLFLGSRISSVATSLGYRFEQQGRPNGGDSLVVVDLQNEGLDLRAIVQNATGRVIAFGPHIANGLLDQARDQGWEVYTRGQFLSNLPQILKPT